MKRKDILTLLVPSLVIAILWVIFSVYHNYVNSTIPVSVNTQILGITPDFDLQTINAIKNRSNVTPIYELSPKARANGEPTPTPDLNTTPLSSASANEASQGGALNP